MLSLNRNKALVIFLMTSLAFVGCNQAQQGGAGKQDPEVLVTQPVIMSVTDYEDFTGRAEAIETVTVRARVTGYLAKVNFVEGMEVTKGTDLGPSYMMAENMAAQATASAGVPAGAFLRAAMAVNVSRANAFILDKTVLFEIEPPLYQAEFDRASANVRQTEAHLEGLEQDYKRAQELIKTRAISQEDFDQKTYARAEAIQAVQVAKAQLLMAETNLGYTKVAAPINGRISNRRVDPGNLVKQDETALTTIRSVDPMYVYFDVDERTMLHIGRLIQEGKVKSYRVADMGVHVGLSDEDKPDVEDKFPHKGRIDFVDNAVDAATGTLRVRGIFANPERRLYPGLFVRVRLPVGQPHPAILVPERALGTDQGQKFLYVVDKDNKVERRNVGLGSQQGEMRVIEKGLAANETVIVGGLQRVRSGDPVRTKPADAPKKG